MIEKVKSKLKQLGYNLINSDDELINLYIEKCESHIKNNCNIDEIPALLEPFEIDYVCGNFLSLKKALGQLEGFDVEQAMTSVKVGDTSVNFSGMSPSEQLDLLFTTLASGLEGELECFRKIRW